jgi:DNA-binding MarR family transcriptional regulator
MSTIGTRGKRAVAADVWRSMAGFTTAHFQSGDRLALLRELGLTPGHMKALGVLDPEEPKPMRALADALSCDASMVTMIVDRLEERGLVERRVLLDDRRVKTLVLTPRGIQTRTHLAEAMSEPPEALLDLKMARLEALRDALKELPPVAQPFWSQSTPPHRREETA